MPSKNQSALIDDKNYHARRNRLDTEIMKLGKRLNKLRQQEKAIQSSNQNNGQETNALKNIRDKIKNKQYEIMDKTFEPFWA